MSGDLISLRMLFVTVVEPGDAAAPPEADYWRQGAAMASVPIEFSAHDATDAKAIIGKGDVDICVLDSAIPADGVTDLVKAASAVEPRPITFESNNLGRARCAGVDAAVPKPTSIDDARRLIDLCARTKVPTRVLIVDDSSTMRSIVRKILSASRFALDIQETAEGVAAIDQLRVGNFGMVFLDYNMPGLNGLDTLAKIKSENPDVAVVMMTSTIDDAIAERATACGAHAFLKKPFYPADIDVVLARYFGIQPSH